LIFILNSISTGKCKYKSFSTALSFCQLLSNANAYHLIPLCTDKHIAPASVVMMQHCTNIQPTRFCYVITLHIPVHNQQVIHHVGTLIA